MSFHPVLINKLYFLRVIVCVSVCVCEVWYRLWMSHNAWFRVYVHFVLHFHMANSNGNGPMRKRITNQMLSPRVFVCNASGRMYRTEYDSNISKKIFAHWICSLVFVYKWLINIQWLRIIVRCTEIRSFFSDRKTVVPCCECAHQYTASRIILVVYFLDPSLQAMNNWKAKKIYSSVSRSGVLKIHRIFWGVLYVICERFRSIVRGARKKL